MDNELKDLEDKMIAKLPKSDAVLEGKIRAKQIAASAKDPDAWDYSNTVQLQTLIDDGSVWRLEGHVGRTAMQALERGECFLPTRSHKDYYGNTVPCRTVLKPGTMGTLLNSAKFWDIPVRGKKQK